MITNFISKLIPIICIILSPFYQGSGDLVSYPKAGDAVRGVVEIRGTITVDSFNSAEIYYAYSSPDQSNWFLINRIDQPVESGVIARWDTTTITDGAYQIKLVVQKTSGTTTEVIVNPIFVRNYSAEPTQQAIPTSDSSSTELTITPTKTPVPFATALPENPASLSNSSIKSSVVSGLIITLLALAALFFYSLVHSRRNLH